MRSCRVAGPNSQINGAPIEILGIPDHATYREHWPLLQSSERAWIRLRPGDAGFVSEQLARRMNLSLGDRIEVAAPGGNWSLEVVGIYADYGNPKGQVAVNFAALTRRFPEIPQTRLGLRVAPAAVPALISALQDKFGLDGRNLLDQATLKAEVAADLQPDLRGHRSVERLHPWRRRHRPADQPVDPEQFPPSPACAAMGDRNHATAACGASNS